MLNNINELKSFISWCKEEKIKSMEIGEVKIEFSELAFIDLSKSLYETDIQQHIEEDKFEAEQAEADDEELLFHSVD